MEWYPIVVNLHFPNDKRSGAFFHMLICHLCFFFGEVSIKVFGPFLNKVIYFLIAEFYLFIYLFIYLLIFGCIGSLFLCEGFL